VHSLACIHKHAHSDTLTASCTKNIHTQICTHKHPHAMQTGLHAFRWCMPIYAAYTLNTSYRDPYMHTIPATYIDTHLHTCVQT